MGEVCIFRQLFNRSVVHKPCFSTGPGAGELTNVHTWSWHQFFSNFPRQAWAINTWPGRLVGKWPCKSFEINPPVDLCSSSMGALQSRLRTASDTPRKFWTRCREVQLTAGQPSKSGQVAQAFANQILKISEAGDFTASLGTLLQGSGTLIAIFLLLPTSGNFPWYTSWLLPLALLPCTGERRLAPSSLYAPMRALKTTVPFPLALSSPGGTKADHLSLHATRSRDARSSSLIAPLQEPRLDVGLGSVDQAGGNALPVCSTLLVTERFKIARKPVLLSYRQYLPTACARARFCRCSKAGGRARVLFSLSRAGAAEHTEAQAASRNPGIGTLWAWLPARFPDSRTESICASHRGEVLEALPDTRCNARCRQTQSQLFPIALYPRYGIGLQPLFHSRLRQG